MNPCKDNCNHHELSTGIPKDKFQEILSARKAERKQLAKQRRLRDLEVIKAKFSKDGEDPSERFPKEIWKIIIDALDPEGRSQLSQVHPLFRNLMEKTKVGDILLPQILDFKIHGVPRSQRKLPLAFNPVLREVSKCLRDGVDRYTENQLLAALHMEEIKIVQNLHLSPSSYYTVHDRPKRAFVRSFFEAEMSNKPKRFPPRSLEISLSISPPPTPPELVNIDSPELFKGEVTSFLQEVGDQIWRFKFFAFEFEETRSIGPSLLDLYSTLHSWLQLMPNLKCLQLHFKIYAQRGREMVLPKSAWSKTAFEELPPPKLENLERLDLGIETRNQQAIQICETFLEEYRNIKILKFYGDNENLETIAPELVNSLNLEAFCCGRDDDFEVELFRIYSIKPVINLDWKLTKMSLSLLSECTRINDVFEFLEKFPTLERVHLGMDGQHMKEENIRFLQLPNVTNFEFNLMESENRWLGKTDFILSLQFLLYCSKLKSLRWADGRLSRPDIGFRNMRGNDCPECMMDFGSGWRDLSESNIWQVFPSLESVILKRFELRNNTIWELRDEYRNRRLFTSHKIKQLF